MLGAFIQSNRDEVIARTRAKVSERAAPRPSEDELTRGIPLFVDQLAARLVDEPPSTGKVGATATIHGKEMLEHGFSVAQVVEDYGHVCQAVTELAIARSERVTTEEFRTLNLCIDQATADAVTEYERQRDSKSRSEETERLGVLAHELRNVLHSAVLSFDMLKRGGVSFGGSTGAVLGRSLGRLRDIIDRALAEVRLDSGIGKPQRIRISELIKEVEVVAAFEANEKGLSLTVTRGDAEVEVEVDRHMLASAVGNLMQNALKFTRPGGQVTLKTYAEAHRVFIDVEDECGGLPPGTAERLFLPFEQGGADRSGLGLGLAISRRAVEANGGQLHVRDLPGTGCVFTIELPRAFVAP